MKKPDSTRQFVVWPPHPCLGMLTHPHTEIHVISEVDIDRKEREEKKRREKERRLKDSGPGIWLNACIAHRKLWVQSPALREAGLTVRACNPSIEELETEGSEV